MAALAVAISASLGACSTLSTRPVPPVPAPAPVVADATVTPRWHAPLPHGGNTSALAQWWAGSDDPLLPALVQDAQATSPLLTQALARIRQARASQRVAASAGGLFVNGNAQAQRGSNAGTSFLTVSQLSAGVDAGWEFDLFGGVRRSVDAAQARAEQAELGWHDARVSLAADVAQTYVGLRTCEALVQLHRQESESLGRSNVLVRRKAEVGFEAPAVARLSDAAAAQARDRVIAQQAECDLSVKALVLLTGRDETALREQLSARQAQLPRPAAFTIDALPAATLAQRPDVAAAERELQASAAEIGVADAARWPQLSINGSVGIGLVQTNGMSKNAMTWGFGPNLTLPLFNQGRLKAQSDAARARYDEARAGYELRLRAAVREVEEALVRLDASQRREPDIRQAAEGLRAYFRSTEERGRLGSASVLEIEDARRQAIGADTALLALRREQVAAWISLYRAAGGGWRTNDPAPTAPNTAPAPAAQPASR